MHYTLYGVINDHTYLHHGVIADDVQQAVRKAQFLWALPPSHMESIREIRLRDWTKDAGTALLDLPIVG